MEVPRVSDLPERGVPFHRDIRLSDVGGTPSVTEVILPTRGKETLSSNVVFPVPVDFLYR